MTFLLVGTKKSKDLEIISPDTYGIPTFGDGYHQEDLKKKGKTWYYTEWNNGGEYLDDTYFEVKCPVLLETTDPDQIIAYIDKNFRQKRVHNDTNLTAMFKKALDEIEKIQHDWVEWNRWVLTERK
jgi:hypothetical protein